MKNGPTVFVSYSHEDSDFFEELVPHLLILQRKGVIKEINDGSISAGEDRAAVLDRQMEQAQIFILLVSAYYLVSDSIWDSELTKIIDRYNQQEANVIAVIVRNCMWKEPPISYLPVFPKDTKPVSLSPNPDKIWLELAEEIALVAKRLGGSK